jgi:hypothetical protein
MIATVMNKFVLIVLSWLLPVAATAQEASVQRGQAFKAISPLRRRILRPGH